MATDTTNFTPDMNSNSADNEPNFDAVQLAQAAPAGAPVQVVIPSGANVVRVPVTAGETIELPFGADAHLLGKLGDNGNLAIKVGDVTVILEGYTAAEGQQPVIIETAEGKPVDVATVLAATDPGLDIQTAAGGAEGAQGADNTGGIFAAFGPGNGLGGFGAVGALDGTALQYKLIDTDAKFFLQGQGEADTHPTPVDTVGQVDENGKKHLHENPFDDCYGGIVTNPSQPGDDEWAAKATFKVVDFGPDGPAAVDALVGDDAGGTKPPCLDTNGNQVYSHGEPIVLIWNAAQGRLEGWVEDSSECDHCPRLVFTATVETSGGVATGDICFKLLGPLDHPFNYDPDATQADGTDTLSRISGDGDGCCDPYAKWHEFEDNIILDLHFAAKDSDDVTSTDIPVKVNVDDDSPAFLDCDFDPCQGYTIVADETHGVQCGTDDVDVTFCFLEAIAGQQVEPGESTIFDKFVCFFGYDAVQNLDICDITAAQKHLKFGYGADGPLVHEICCDGSEGNPEVPSLQSLGKQEGYNQNGDCIINCGALLTNSCGDVYFCEDTKLTITVGDCEETHTLCVKMEGFGNTIFGYAEDYGQQSIQGGEGGGCVKIPVFIITIDPDTKELTYVQLHQINNDNPWDPNEANDGGEGSCHVLEQINIGLAVTDYDHDSIWTPVHVTVLDDGPKLECVTYNCVETIYSNDFSSDDLKSGELIDGLGGTPYAIITGGSLQLTDESFSHNDSQWLKIDGGSEFHGSFHASFDVILNDTGEGGSADGFSFQVGNDVNTDDNDGVGAEESNTSGFALTFDTYDNDGDSSNPADVGDEIAVWFNGVKLDSVSDLGDLNGLSPLNVSVDVQGSHYSVIINGTEYFHGNLGGTIPSDADFYLGARTGGEADIQGVDNICITAPCTEAHVDEDFLYKGNHDTDGGPGAHGDDEGSVCATGQVHVDFGRDQPGSFCLDKLTITDDKGCVVFDGCQVDNLYTSKGDHVDVEFCGDKVIGTACGKPVFTLTIDCNGCFKFELCQALEHPLHNDPSTDATEKNFEDNLHFDFGVKAIDCDGDAVCTDIKVNVDDDAPVICGVCYISEDTGYQDTQVALVSTGGKIYSCEYGSVDEDWLPKGNHDYDTNPDNLNSPFGDGNNGDGPGGLCVTGHIDAKVGADQPGTYSFNIPGLCVGGEPVPTCLTTSNGDHPISLVLCQEGCNWVVKGVYDCNGDAEGGEAEAFRITLDSKCGDFKFELEAALQHPDSDGNSSNNAWDDGFARYEDDICLNFGVKLTDSDGDSACTTLTFKVDDDAPVICDVTYHNQNTGQPVEVKVDGAEGHTSSKYGEVDEDFLPKGNHDKDTNPDNLNSPYGDGNNGDGPGGTCVTGCINAKIGADQPGSFLFDIPGLCETGDTIPTCLKTSNGDHPISLVLCQEGCNWVVKGVYDCNGDAEGGEAEAFRVTLDSKTGEFKFELEAALQHPDSNGNPADNHWDDGVSRYEDDICLDFGVKVVDSDGDAAKTCLTFKVDDDAPVICGVTYHNQNTGEPVEVRVDGGEGHTSSKYGEVDEDWLPKGNHDKDTNPDNISSPFGVDGNNGDGPGGLCVTGCIEAKIGADQPGSFLFDIPGLCKSGDTVETCLKTSNGDHPISLVLCQEGCNWIVKGIFDCNGDAEGGETEAFRVTLDSKTGEFKFELEAALEHPDTNGNPADNKWDDGFSRYEDDICLDFHVKVVDSDGDAAKTCLTFKVDDDAPVICDVTYHNQETGQPEVQILTDGGEGTPEPKAQYGQVDEDWLPNGNHDHDTNPDNNNSPFGTDPNNNGDGPGGLCVTGCIEAKIGADQPGSFLFNIPGLCESGDSVESCYKTSEGYPITLTLCQEGCNWVVKGTYIDGTVDQDPTEEAFKITLDSKTGQFKFELETALQHPDTNGDHSDDATDNGKSSYEDDLLVKFDVKVVDSDGDAAKTCLVFKVDDDAPTLDGSSCYTTNLLVNGSFEDPQQGPGAWTTYSNIPGWSADNEAANGPIEIQNNTVFTAADGNQYLELDSNNYANNNAHVQQQVALAADDVDGTFLLTFSYTPRTDVPATNQGEVLWNGQVVATLDGTGTPGVWQTISVLVHGDSTNAQNGLLEFRGLDGDGNDESSDSLGGFIDNVSLKCVVSVDEDASLDPANRAPGNEGGPGDDGVVGHCATGNLGVTYGADGPGGINFDPTCQPTGLTSHGETVEYKSDGAGGLIAFIANGPSGGEETIFTLTVQTNGDFKFDLVRPLDHPDSNNDHSDDATDDGKGSFEDNLVFGLKFTATDADGDAIKGSLTINVDDDSPTQVGKVDWTVDEDAHHTADSWEPGHPLTGGLEGGPGDSSTDWIGFKANLGVSFGADGPAAIPYGFAGLEGDPVTGKDSNGAPLGPLTSGGEPIVYHWDAGTSTLTGVAGALTIFTATVDQSNGDLTFQLTGPIDHPFNADGSKVDAPSSWEDEVSIDLKFTATDYDGDSTVACATIRIDDDSPIQTGSVNWTVDEDAHHLPDPNWEPGAPLPGGIEGGPGDSSTDWVGFKANLGVSFGADGPAAVDPYGFAGKDGDAVTGKDSNGADMGPLTSGGVAIVYDWDEATSTLSGKAGALTIFTAQIDQSNGELSFQLTGPIDHPFNADGAKVDGVSSWEDEVSIALNFTATDNDGDSILAVATVSIDDDSPAFDGTSCYTSNLLVNGSFEDPQQNPGAWTTYSNIPGWTANNEAANGPIEIQNNTVVTAADGNQYLELDSNNYANNNAHVQQQVALAPDDVNGTFLLTFSYSPRTDVPGTNEGEVWWNGAKVADLDGTGTPGVWQTISVLVHGDSSNLQNGLLEFRGKDADGNDASSDSLGGFIDNVSLKCVVSVDEDASLDPANRAPGIEGGPGDDGVVGHCATGNLGVAFGADGPGGINFDPTCQTADLKSHGEAVQFESDGNGGLIAFIATGHEIIFTLTVQDNGDFKFDLINPLDHPGHDDPSQEGTQTSFEDNLLFDLKFVATDNDGDAIKGSLTINVDDDSPTACHVQAECLDESTFPSHTVTITAGQDVPAGVSLTAEDQDTSNGNTSSVETSSNGIGVNTTPDDNTNPDSDGGASATPGHNRFDEINYTGSLSSDTPGAHSEHLFVNLTDGSTATHATVNLTVFYTGEGGVGTEQGAYRLWNDGVAGAWVTFAAENAGGTKTLEIDDKGGFDRIEFVALPGTTDPSGNAGGDSSDYSIGSVVLTIQDPIHTCGEFCANFGADGPGSVALVAPDVDLTSNGSPIDLKVSDDGHTLTGTINGGLTTVFELTIDPDTGKYDLDLYRPIDNKSEDDLHIPVQYTVTDFDGDAVNGCITLCVDGNDIPTITIIPGVDRPVGDGGVLLVDEDAGLPGSLPGDVANGDNNGVLHTSGTAAFNFGADGPGAFGLDSSKVSEGVASGLTDYNGNAIKFHVDAASTPGHEIVTGFVDSGPAGFDAGDKQYFKLDLNDADGKFTFDLLNAVNHPINPTEDNVQVSFGVKVTDSDGDAATANIVVDIDDDAPESVQDTKALSGNGFDTNLMIVLDISGSMGDASGLTALDRLDAARAAINELFEQYDNLGNVAVKIVTFSTGAGEEPGGWHTIAEAKAFLDSLNPGGTTNYGAAIAQAETAFAESGKIVGGENVSYFISDGKPNPAATGLDAGEQTAWESFVTTNHIISQAIGIGTGVTATELNPIAFDGVHNIQIPSIIVTDLGGLNAALVGTLAGLGVSGELDGTPSKFGADGGFIKAITLDGTTYNYDRNLNSVGAVGANHATYDTTTHILSIATALDGVLAVNLADGSYAYNRSSDPNDHGTENVSYLLSDNDGDTAASSLAIQVSVVDLPPIARDDHVITNVHNGGGNETFTISDAALLWNDTDANHDPMAITGISNISGLASVTHTAPNVIAVDGSGGGSFDYTNTSTTLSDTAHVTIDRGQEDEGTLDGDGLDNILIARDSNTTLKGYEGKDVLIGGTADDLMIGGKGDDLIDLSKGGSDTVRIETKLDGNDVVLGFSTTNGATHDAVDLDALFDGYGAMSGTRASHVSVTAAGLDTHVNVDTDNNVGNGYEMTITLVGVTAANVIVGNGVNDEVHVGS